MGPRGRGRRQRPEQHGAARRALLRRGTRYGLGRDLSGTALRRTVHHVGPGRRVGPPGAAGRGLPRGDRRGRADHRSRGLDDGRRDHRPGLSAGARTGAGLDRAALRLPGGGRGRSGGSGTPPGRSGSRGRGARRAAWPRERRGFGSGRAFRSRRRPGQRGRVLQHRRDAGGRSCRSGHSAGAGCRVVSGRRARGAGDLDHGQRDGRLPHRRPPRRVDGGGGGPREPEDRGAGVDGRVRRPGADPDGGRGRRVGGVPSSPSGR